MATYTNQNYSKSGKAYRNAGGPKGGRPKGEMLPAIRLLDEGPIAIPLERAVRESGLSKPIVKANAKITRCGAGDYVSPKAVNAYITRHFGDIPSS